MAHQAAQAAAGGARMVAQGLGVAMAAAALWALFAANPGWLS